MSFHMVKFASEVERYHRVYILITVRFGILDVGRKFAQIEVNMHSQNDKVARALVICKMFDEV